MMKKKLWIALAVAVALGLGFIIYRLMVPKEYIPSSDEIALHIRLDTKEDIGLLVYDCRADDTETSGGVSNADRSMLRHDSDDLFAMWNKQELDTEADAVDLTLRFRIITEYADPNYENIYPDDISCYLDPVSWKAHFGESYSVTITGDRINGYQAVLN